MIGMHKWQAEVAKSEALIKRVHELASLSITLNDALFRLYAHAGVPVSQMEPEQLNGALDEAAAALAKFREVLDPPQPFRPNSQCKSPENCRSAGFCDDAWHCSSIYAELEPPR